MYILVWLDFLLPVLQPVVSYNFSWICSWISSVFMNNFLLGCPLLSQTMILCHSKKTSFWAFNFYSHLEPVHGQSELPSARRIETLWRESCAGPQQSLKGWGMSTMRGDWDLGLFRMEKGRLRQSQSICINSRDWGMRDEEGTGCCLIVPTGRIRASGH